MGRIIQPIGDRIIIPNGKIKKPRMWMGREDQMPPRVFNPKLSLNSILTSGGVHGPSASPSGGPPACESGTEDTGYDNYNGNTAFSFNVGLGQSFKTTKNGYLYSIGVYCSVYASTKTLTGRVKSGDADFNTYDDTGTGSLTGTGWVEIVMTEHIALTADVQYYFGVRQEDATANYLYIHTGGDYANGQFHTTAGYPADLWDFDQTPGGDLNFYVKLCDE